MAGIRADINIGINKRSLDRAAAEVNRVMGGLGKKGVNFSINDRSFTQPLGRITGAANEFTKSLEASNARVIAFGASVGIINGISNAFKALVMETIQFEKTLADVNVVLNASSISLERFGAGLFDVAKNTAQSFNVAAEAALEFSRQGLSMQEVLKRTNDALMLTRLTSLKAAEAVAGLTAAVNAFSDVGLTTTQVIDKLAAVDVKFAVSAEDLIHALERTGAVAIDAGVELDSLIGLVTSLQQTTARGGAVIGNGLKTIFTRIQRPEALKQLEQLDIQIKNIAGSVLPADQILQNMAKTFDTLTQAQQSNLVQFSSGIFQANIFRGILRDLAKDQSIATQATNVAANAAGEAAVKNDQLNKSLQAMASQTGTALRELAGVMGDLMVKPELGSALGFFQNAIEGLKNMLGGGEKTGSTFAKGLVRGIGNILTGPTAIAFGAIFLKLFINIAKFAGSSMKDVLGLVNKKEKIRQMEESIVDALSRNKDLQIGLNSLEGDRKAQEAFILKILEAQTNAMRQQQLLARRLARPLVEAGVGSDFSVPAAKKGPVDLDGDGIADVMTITARGMVPRDARRRERREARRGGYAAGPVDSLNIKGVGPVVYNKAEKVKQFPGMQQPAIMPPQQSRAGRRYQAAFGGRHGFDPYAGGGFIPNFQLQNRPNMGLQAGPNADFPQYIKNQLTGGSGMVTFKTKAANLKGGAFGNIGELLNTLGISEIETTIPVDAIQFPTTATGRMTPQAQNILAGRDTKAIGALGEGSFLGSTAGAGYRSTGADEQAVVDAIGEGKMPQEVKGGSVELQNVFEKSIRRYSNKAFRRQLQGVAFSNMQNTDPAKREAAKQLSQQTKRLKEETIIRNLMTLAHMGEWTPQGLSQEETKDLMTRGGGALRKKMLQIGIQPQDLERLESVGLGGGFVPNYQQPHKSTVNYDQLHGWFIDHEEISGGGWSSEFESFAEAVRKYNAHYGTSHLPAGIKDSFFSRGGASSLTLRPQGTHGTTGKPLKEAKGAAKLDVTRYNETQNAIRNLIKKGSAGNNEAAMTGMSFERRLSANFGLGGLGKRPFDYNPKENRGLTGVGFPGKDAAGNNIPHRTKVDLDMDAHTEYGDAFYASNPTTTQFHTPRTWISRALRQSIEDGVADKRFFQRFTGTKTKTGASGQTLRNPLKYREIIGGFPPGKADTPMSPTSPFSAIFNAKGGQTLRDTIIKKRFATDQEITGWGAKTVSFNYLRDYIDADPLWAGGGFIPNFFDDEIDERSMEYVAAAMDPEGSLENASLMARAAYLKKYGNGGDDQKLKTLITDSFAAEIAAKKYLHHKNTTDKALAAEGLNRKMSLSSIPGVGEISERDIDLVAGNLLKGYDRGQGAAGGFIPNFGLFLPKSSKVTSDPKRNTIKTVKALGEGDIPVGSARFSDLENIVTPKGAGRAIMMQGIENLGKIKGGGAMAFSSIVEYARENGIDYILSDGIREQHKWANLNGRGGTNWGKVLQQYPQLRYRLQPGLKTSVSAGFDWHIGKNAQGIETIGTSDEEYPSLASLKHFVGTSIGDYNIQMSSMSNLDTFVNASGAADGAAYGAGFVPNFAKNPRKGNILDDWEGILGDGSGEGNKYLMEKVSRGSPNWNRDISLSGPHRLESKIKKYRELGTGEEKEYEQKNLFPTDLINNPKHPLRSPNQWVRSIKRGRIREGGARHQGLDVWQVNRSRRSALDAIRDKAKEPHKKAAIKTLTPGDLDILDVDNHLGGTALQLDEDGKTWLYWGASQKGHLALIEQLQAEGVPMREASTSLGGYDYGTQIEPPPTSVVQGFRQGGPGTRWGAGGFVPNFAQFEAGGKESIYSANVASRAKGLRGRDLRMFDRYYANPALAFARTERLNTVGSIIPDIQSDLLGKKNAHVNQMLAQQVTKGIISKGEKERLMGLSMGSLLEIDKLVNQQARMLQTRNLGQAFDPATEKLYKEQAAYLAQTRYLDLEIQIAKKYLNNYGRKPPKNVMDKMGMMTSYGVPGERALQFSTFDSQYGEWGGLMLRNAGGGFIPNFVKDLDPRKNPRVTELMGKLREITSLMKEMERRGVLNTLSDKERNMVFARMKLIMDELESLGVKTPRSSPGLFGKPGAHGVNAVGFIPNFANPLREAIGREMGAGIPKSQIRVEQSSQLRGPSNPMGLAVTNKRDEPAGIGQGIRRARSHGIDPRKHGAGRGFFPNFAGDDTFKDLEEFKRILKELEKSDVFMVLAKNIKKMIRDMQKEAGAIEKSDMGIDEKRAELEKQMPQLGEVGKVATEKAAAWKGDKGGAGPEQLKKSASAIDALTSSMEENSDAQGAQSQGLESGLQKLFFFQSLISMSNGFLEEFATSTNRATQTFAKLGMVLSDTTAAYIQQKNIIAEVTRAFSPGEKQKGLWSSGEGVESIFGGKGAKGGGPKSGAGAIIGKVTAKFGGLAKGLVRFLPVVGQLYTLFTLVNKAFTFFTEDGESAMDLMASGAKRASNRLEKLGEISEKVTGSLETMKNAEEGQTKIMELETKGKKRSFKEDKELFELRLKQIKLQTQSAQQQSELMVMATSRVGIEQASGKMFQELIASGLGAADALRGVQKGISEAELMSTITKGFQEAVNAAENSIFAWTEQEFEHIEDPKVRAAIQERLTGQMGNIATALGPELAKALAEKVGNMDFEEKEVSGLGLVTGFGVDEEKWKQAILDVKTPSGEKINLPLATEIGKIVTLIDDEIKGLEVFVEAIQDSADQEQTNTKITKDREHSFRESQLLLMKINNDLKIQEINVKDTIALDRKILDIKKLQLDNEIKNLKSLGKLSKGQAVQADHIAAINQLDAKHLIDTREINEKGRLARLEAIRGTIKTGLNAKKMEEKYFRDPSGKLKKEGAMDFATDIAIAGAGATGKHAVGIKKNMQALFNSIKAQKKASNKTLDFKNIEAGLLQSLMKETNNKVLLATLTLLEEKDILTVTKEIETKLNLQNRLTKQELETLGESRKIAKVRLELQRKQKHIDEKTIEGLVYREALYRKQGPIEVAIYRDKFAELGHLKQINKYHKDELDFLLASDLIRRIGLQNAISTLREEGRKEMLAVSEVAARVRLLDTTEDGQKVMALRFIKEEQNAKLAAEEARIKADYLSNILNALEMARHQAKEEKNKLKSDEQNAKAKLYEAITSGNLAENARKRLSTELLTLDLDILNLKAKQDQYEANKEIAQRLEESKFLQDQLNALDEARNAVRAASISQDQFTLSEGIKFTTEKAESVKGLKEVGGRAITTGRTEDILKYVEALRETNLLFDRGGRKMAAFREKILELELSSEKLGEELISTGIDQTRTGLVQLFKDIAHGAKEADDAWSDFGLGLANALAERMIKHNVDQIIGDLMYAFTGESKETIQEKIAGEIKKLTDEVMPKLTIELGVHETALSKNTQALRDFWKNRRDIDVDRGLEEPSDFDNLVQSLRTRLASFGDLIGDTNTSLQTYTNIVKAGGVDLGVKMASFVSVIQTGADQIRTAMANAAQKLETVIPGLSTDPAGDPVGDPGGPAGGGTWNQLYIKATNQDRDAAAARAGKIAAAKAVAERKQARADAHNKEEWAKWAVWDAAKEARERSAREPSMFELSLQQAGGRVQHFARGGLVQGGGSGDSVPAMLTPGEMVIPKGAVNEMIYGGVASTAAGAAQSYPRGQRSWGPDSKLPTMNESRTTWWDKAQKWGGDFPGPQDGSFKSRFYHGIAGSAQAITMGLVANEIGRALTQKQDTPPTFNYNKLNTLDLGSDVSIKRGDARLSSKFLAEDPVMGEYRQYLLDYAAYEVQKKNEKQQEKMQTLGSIVGAMNSFVISQVTGLLAKPMNKLITAGKNFAGRTFGEHKSAFKAAEAMGLNVDYKDVSNAMEKHDGVLKVGDSAYQLVNAPDSENFLGGRHDSRGQIYDLSDPTAGMKVDKGPSTPLVIRPDGTITGGLPTVRKTQYPIKRVDYNNPENYKLYGFKSREDMVEAGVNTLTIKQRQELIRHNVTQTRGGPPSTPTDQINTIKLKAAALSAEQARKSTNSYLAAQATQWAQDVIGYEGDPQLRPGIMTGSTPPVVFSKISELQAQFDSNAKYGGVGGKAGGYFENHPKQVRLLAQINALGEQAGNKRIYYEDGERKLGEFDAWSQKPVRRAAGGTIPTMLTSGESVIPASTAKRMGYGNLDQMNRSGNIPIIQGPGGRDQVGPVGLTPGDFVIRRGSTSKLLNDNPNLMRFAMQNPDGFRKAAAGYYDGGLVGEGDMAYSRGTQPVAAQDAGAPVNRLNLLSSTDSTSSMDATGAQRNETTNNININVSIDGSGAETTMEDGDPEARYNREKELSTKIKNAVVEVIRQEKRIGGELN